MTNTEYRITNKDGVMIEVNEAELFEIAEHWVEDQNTYSYALNIDNKWESPTDIDQVEEILEEYMQCEVVQLDEYQTVNRDTHKMYLSIL